MTYNCLVEVDAGQAGVGGDQEQAGPLAGESLPSAPPLQQQVDVVQVVVGEVELELVGWPEQVDLQGELVHPPAPPLHQPVP